MIELTTSLGSDYGDGALAGAAWLARGRSLDEISDELRLQRSMGGNSRFSRGVINALSHALEEEARTIIVTAPPRWVVRRDHRTEFNLHIGVKKVHAAYKFEGQVVKALCGTGHGRDPEHTEAEVTCQKCNSILTRRAPRQRVVT